MVAGGTVPGGQEQFDIRTPGGGTLAVWVEGEGRPLVLVHGSLGDHTGFTALVEEMKSDCTTFAMDRRGFGASVDTDDYSIEREFEDVAALVDWVAERNDGPITLLGHSFGANCAMGGAARTSNVQHLILYEPSLGMRSSVEAVERELAAGNREAAVMMMLVEQLEMSPDEVAALRATPRWAVLLAGAHTMPREGRVETGWEYSPGIFSAISAPTLMLAGSESTSAVIGATVAAAAAIPDAWIRVLPGHGHFAHRVDPELVAGIIREFVETRRN